MAILARVDPRAKLGPMSWKAGCDFKRQGRKSEIQSFQAWQVEARRGEGDSAYRHDEVEEKLGRAWPQTPHWSRGQSQSRTQPGAEGRQYGAREKARPCRACVRRSKEQHGSRGHPHHRHCSRACKIGLTPLAHNLRRFVFLERMEEVAR
jgi:hypothetical protein